MNSPPVSWHSLDFLAVAESQKSSLEGLSREQARQRLKTHGANELSSLPPPNALWVLLHQFQSPLIYILLAAAVVTFLLGDYADSTLILVAVSLNAVIGFIQEWKAEHSARALMKLVSPKARVVRDGREQTIESKGLIPGDVVLLESGVRTPADLRLFQTTTLAINESTLTGESIPVHKGTEAVAETAPLAERRCMAYAGTVVTAGRGRGIVVTTGARTELGTIAAVVREEVSPESPLQRRMTNFAHVIGYSVGIAAVLAFVVGIASGKTASEMVRVGVALAVGAVPEGLPVVLIITLALGVRRMAKRNAIVRRLPAVETLGCTSVIGSDKTGTLTENRMTTMDLWTSDGFTKAPSERTSPEHLASPLRETLEAGVFSNEAEVDWSSEELSGDGDPTETALLVAAYKFGLEPAQARQQWKEIATIPFESERQFAASIRRADEGDILYVKGAPEVVLGMSSRLRSADGTTDLDPEAVLKAADEMASNGLRVLAMARGRAELKGEGGEVLPPRELTFLGLQGMLDPPRAEVKDAIEGCRQAGIRVVMITGDHARTAVAIGAKLGIGGDNPEVLTGRELDAMSEKELQEHAETVSIFARVSPQHKLQVVHALRALGHVVAVTGDGVNDAPALKAADIGVAMGKSGTDVAREAADMILADDNFASIYAAVHEGRVTFANVRKVTFFLVSTGAAIVIMLLAALVLGWPLPVLPAQILWINLVTSGLQDLALAFEPAEPGLDEKPPRDPKEGVVSKLLWERTVLAGFVMAIGTLALFRWEYLRTGSLIEAQTIALTSLVIFMFFHVGNARSDTRSLLQISPISNPHLFTVSAVSLAVHVGCLYFAPTQAFLSVHPLDPPAWIRLIAVASSILVVVEAHKWIRRRWPLEGSFRQRERKHRAWPS